MSRHKAAQHCKILPWLSARENNQEGRFLQIGNSLFLCDHFQNLSDGTKYLYLCMALESGGKKDFQFTRTSAKKYGISSSSLRRHVAELKESGFISFSSGANLRQPNEYIFSFEWKADPS